MEYRNLTFEVKYKKVMHISAKIKNGEISVTAPFYTPINKVYEFIDEYYSRIEKILLKQQEFKSLPFTIWGKAYNLKTIKSDKNKVEFFGDDFIVYYKDDFNIVLDRFYADEVKIKLPTVIEKYNYVIEKYNLYIKKLTVRKMSSRWGSCVCSKRFIAINSNLAKYDPIFLEYVFCHEIAHIKYPNHSKDFHNFLQSYFENENAIRKELKKYY